MVSPLSPLVFLGLGNPGAQYVSTRHNAGFMAVDALAERLGVRFSVERSFKGEAASASIGGQKVHLLKPQTFMNLSGESLQPLLSFYKIPLAAVVVLHDELDLAPGNIQVRFGGGDGGHNGLKSISALCGGKDFYRIRLGIGRPPHPDMATADWVLARFGSQERDIIEEMLVRGVEAALCLQGQGLAKAQNQFNQKLTSL